MSSPIASPQSLRYMQTPSLKAQQAIDRVIALRQAAEKRALEVHHQITRENASRLSAVQSHLSASQRRGEDVRHLAARALMRDVKECPAGARSDDDDDSTNGSLSYDSIDDHSDEEWSLPTSEDDAEGDFIHHHHPWDPPLVSLDDQQEIQDVMEWVGYKRRLANANKKDPQQTLPPHMTPPLSFTREGTFGLRGRRSGAKKCAKKAACRSNIIKKLGLGKAKRSRTSGGDGFRLPPSTESPRGRVAAAHHDDNDTEDVLANIRRAGQRLTPKRALVAEPESSPRLHHASPGKKKEAFRERADALQLLSDARRRDALRHEVHTASQTDEFASARLSSVRRAAASSQHALPKLWTN